MTHCKHGIAHLSKLLPGGPCEICKYNRQTNADILKFIGAIFVLYAAFLFMLG